ncbi:MAG: methionine gamma-lyase family protein [Candidatus Melainabacteria bacterium]|nr:methionine gamma-lyase family protein [Candidatus Melainabacteria bacterium]
MGTIGGIRKLETETSPLIENGEKYLAEYFKSVEDVEEKNSKKVLSALIENKLGEEHFSWVTGYGHDDLGRQKLDQIFARIFSTESAIVRPHFVSGTHAISCCFFGCLRPGDELVSVSGEPYDTLHEVIGIKNKNGSLRDHGVIYKEIPLKNNFDVDTNAIPQYVSKKTKMVFIQRSKGYHYRKSLTISDIKKIISVVKEINKNIICFVDNCFGEFTEELEPTDVGADLICGSLIKNIGGGIVPGGGYIAGRKDLVHLAASRLTAPGIAEAGGSMFDLTRTIFQGLFFAPHVVCQVLKGISLVSYVFQEKGYEVNPSPADLKTDVVVAIKLKEKLLLEKICKFVQSHSPVNSYLTPVPCKLPGYEDEIIMAGGTFIEGSTIELSCDGPLREPYILYWQGGLNYFHTRYVISSLLSSFF